MKMKDGLMCANWMKLELCGYIKRQGLNLQPIRFGEMVIKWLYTRDWKTQGS